MSQQPPPYGPGGGQGTGMPQGARMQMAGQQGMNRGMMNQGNSQQANFMANRMAQQQQHAGRMPMQQGKGDNIIYFNANLILKNRKYKTMAMLYIKLLSFSRNDGPESCNAGC